MDEHQLGNLERLALLREKGLLSLAEFESEKAKLLATTSSKIGTELVSQKAAPNLGGTCDSTSAIPTAPVTGDTCGSGDSKTATLEWGRIVRYFIFIWILTSGVGFIFGFLKAALVEADASRGQVEDMVNGLVVMQGLVVLSSLCVLSARFAYRLKNNIFVSTLVLSALVSLSGLLVNVLGLNQPFQKWLGGALLLLLTQLMGCALAIPFRRRRST